MTEQLPLNQIPPAAKEISAYLKQPNFRIFKKLIDGEEVEIKPEPEIKTYRIPAIAQEPEKEITTYLYSHGKTVTKTTYYWGQWFNVNS